MSPEKDYIDQERFHPVPCRRLNLSGTPGDSHGVLSILNAGPILKGALFRSGWTCRKGDPLLWVFRITGNPSGGKMLPRKQLNRSASVIQYFHGTTISLQQALRGHGSGEEIPTFFRLFEEYICISPFTCHSVHDAHTRGPVCPVRGAIARHISIPVSALDRFYDAVVANAAAENPGGTDSSAWWC